MRAAAVLVPLACQLKQHVSPQRQLAAGDVDLVHPINGAGVVKWGKAKLLPARTVLHVCQLFCMQDSDLTWCLSLACKLDVQCDLVFWRLGHFEDGPARQSQLVDCTLGLVTEHNRDMHARCREVACEGIIKVYCKSCTSIHASMQTSEQWCALGEHFVELPMPSECAQRRTSECSKHCIT